MSNTTLNAVICEMSISVWTARKLDKQAGREVRADKAANSDEAARVTKNLFAGRDDLKKITDFVAAARGEFYAMTLPWSDSGQRLVPMMQFFELKTWVDTQKDTFDALVAVFLNDYPTLISAQAFQLGQLFSRADYPLPSEIAGKFRFNVGFLPLPVTGDFRLDGPAEMMVELEVQYNSMYQDRVKQVNKDLWDRLHGTLTHLSERLEYDTDGKPKVFRNSLIENAVELADLLTRLNVTNDPKMEQARKELESMLLGVDADEVRKPGAREEIKERVDVALQAWW